MQSLTIYQVDAFTDELFRGNPAAVVPLERWLPDALMQDIAAENSLAETAFFVPDGPGFALRWFTPATEVALCGHATLASAFVILHVLEPTRAAVEFSTRSGTLTVRRDGNQMAMDFPRRGLRPAAPPPALWEGLKVVPREVWQGTQDTNYYVVFDTAAQVRAVQPDFALLAGLYPFGVVVTAPGDGCDFVSRYFAPSYGIPEDPVTGSTHCVLIPYWAERLGKRRLRARQVSRRGGDLVCEDQADGVTIAGRAVLYLQGTLSLA